MHCAVWTPYFSPISTPERACSVIRSLLWNWRTGRILLPHWKHHRLSSDFVPRYCAIVHTYAVRLQLSDPVSRLSMLHAFTPSSTCSSNAISLCPGVVRTVRAHSSMPHFGTLTIRAAVGDLGLVVARRAGRNLYIPSRIVYG